MIISIVRKRSLSEKDGAAARGCRANILNPVLLLAILVSMLSGCSSTLSLKPAISTPPGLRKLQVHAGFFHSSAFCAYQQTADVYGNKHTFVFPIGAASDTLFKSVYPDVFQRVTSLKNRTVESSAAEKVAVVIEPEIESFQFPLQSLMGPYWAEIIYRFTLYASDGKRLVSWTAKGWGEGGDGRVYGEFGPIAEATDNAMQSAARKFIRSFEHVPEVKRWAAGMPAEGATAFAGNQVARFSETAGAGVVEGSYKGVVTVSVKLNADPGTQASGSDSALARVGISAVEVLVKNEGQNHLLLDPSNMVWAPAGRQEIFPVPVSLIAAALTTRYGRIGPVATGVGPAALPALFTSLANAAAIAAERKEIASNLEVYGRKELHETVLQRAETVAGLAYFPAEINGSGGGELRVPVIDVDSAVRYVVHLPVKAN